VVELERPLVPGELQASLARTLGDPSLELRYALEGRDRWLDSRGRRASLTRPGVGPQAYTATLVEREGRPLAALIHDPALDQGLVRAAAAAPGMAIENARLHAEVRARLEEVRASRQRIVEAGDRERRRVERNLHDGAQQRLAALALSLARLRERGFDTRLPEPVETVAYFVVSQSLANVAKYARASGARVALSRCNGTLRVEIVDDGVGGADASRGSGLRGLEDRVSAVRGSFRVETWATGEPVS
jgi:signal transduction histidine kinase